MNREQSFAERVVQADDTHSILRVGGRGAHLKRKTVKIQTQKSWKYFLAAPHRPSTRRSFVGLLGARMPLICLSWMLDRGRRVRSRCHRSVGWGSKNKEGAHSRADAERRLGHRPWGASHLSNPASAQLQASGGVGEQAGMVASERQSLPLPPIVYLFVRSSRPSQCWGPPSHGCVTACLRRLR